MDDKSLHESIARQVKPWRKQVRPLSSIEPTVIRTYSPLPKLTPPKLGVFPAPGRGYVYLSTKVSWTRENWWRFKRAAYARGTRATTLMRDMMQQVIDDYERTLERK